MTRQELATRHRVWLAAWLDALSVERCTPLADGKAFGLLTRDLARVSGMTLRAYDGVYESVAKDRPNATETLAERSAGSLNGGTFKEGASTRQSSKKQDSRKPLYSEDFLAAFWCHWKWRGSKMLASQEWEKLSAEDRELVTTDLIKKRRGERDPNWVKDGGRFVVAAERYLKRRLWEEQWEASAESRVLGDDGEVPR